MQRLCISAATSRLLQRGKTRTLGITYAMGHVVYPQVTDPGSVDVSWMIGRRIAEVSFQEPVSWTFYFGQKGYINVDCPWRILNEGRTARSSADHRQQYGLPAPIDAAAEAMMLLSTVVIDAAQLRVGTSDILIDFSGKLRLEILPISSGYEGWQMMDPSGTEFFAQGGGQISILRSDA